VVALLLLGFLFCGVALVLAVESTPRGRTARRAALGRAARYATVETAARVAPGPERPRLLEHVVPALSRIALRALPRSRPEKITRRLEAAGLGTRLNVQRFLALKTVLAVLVLVIAFGLDGVTGKGLLLAIMLLAAALLLPDYVLIRRAQARAELLAADLPQAIDQIVVSLEAGLAFDAALSYFVQRSRSAFARELRIVLSEIRMGESRPEALKRLAERVPHPDVRSFVHTLVQAEGVGISRVPLLKSQAADLRHRRQLAAEEKAQKAPVKMLFPTLIFILPVMFVVLLGPAFQQSSRIFGP
jgi:tight adherence protein C